MCLPCSTLQGERNMRWIGRDPEPPDWVQGRAKQPDWNPSVWYVCRIAPSGLRGYVRMGATGLNIPNKSSANIRDTGIGTFTRSFVSREDAIVWIGQNAWFREGNVVVGIHHDKPCGSSPDPDVEIV